MIQSEGCALSQEFEFCASLARRRLESELRKMPMRGLLASGGRERNGAGAGAGRGGRGGRGRAGLKSAPRGSSQFQEEVVRPLGSA